MSMRKESARWRAPTHALVSFDGENANSVVPVKLIGYSKVGDKCDVVWPNDKKKYSGTVIALGTEQEMNSVLDDDIDDDDDNDGGVDSGGTDESSEECDEDLVQQCSKKRKYSVKPHLPSEKPHPPSEKPHPPSEKPHPPSEKPHTPSRKPHTSSEKPCHPMSEKPHHSSEKPPSQKSNTDKECHI